MPDPDLAPPTDPCPGGHELLEPERVQWRYLWLSVEGLTAPSKEYGDLICLDPTDDRAGMMRASGCAEVGRGLLWRSGIRHRCLGKYITEHAVSDVVQVLIDARAVLPKGTRAKVGDLVVMLGSAGPHVFGVVGLNGDVVTTMQGGERTKEGLETIKRIDRVWSSLKILYVGDALALSDAASW